MKPVMGIVAVVAALAGAPAAFGQAESPDLRTPDTSMDLSRQPEAAKPKVVPFGQAHSKWWTVGWGIADNFEDSTDFNIRAAYSHFLVQDVEFSAELNGWYFHQAGSDAEGINPAMVFRWHFFNDGTWTAFGDVGIGVLLCTDEVPTGGTQFNFTPRVGVGFTRELDADTRTRLQVGLRWHHISNARIDGASDNPSRDGIMLYAGIQFPY